MALYPLQFKPIFKQTIWGGEKLNKFFHKSAPEGTGESWEISGLADHDSVVSTGALAGRTLRSLCQQYGAELLGKKVVAQTGTEFPLLFKFIDAKQDLSLQVHPNNELAQKRHNCFGKTEMWYVVQADEGAQLINGFTRDLPKSEYAAAVESGAILDYVGKYQVHAGDGFFIPAGRIHGIGAGILIAEIQQTSNITYRLYDYHRKDKDGNERTLHTQEGFEALDFSVLPNAVIRVEDTPNVSQKIVSCPFFTVKLISLQEKMERYLLARDSFVAYMVLEGSVELECEGESYVLSAGQSILIPAALAKYTLQSPAAKLLQVYI